MSARKDSVERGSFFFEPLVLHLQTADLLIQRLLVNGRFRLLPFAPVLEQLRRVLQQLLFPRRNLRRMRVELLSQLLWRVARHADIAQRLENNNEQDQS